MPITINYNDSIVGDIVTNVDYTSTNAVEEYNRIMTTVSEAYYGGNTTPEELAQALKDLEKLLKEGVADQNGITQGITLDMYTKAHNLIAMLQTAGISIGDPSSVNTTTIANWQNIRTVTITERDETLRTMTAETIMETLEAIADDETQSYLKKFDTLFWDNIFGRLQDKQSSQADFLELLGMDYEFYSQMQKEYANVTYNTKIPKDPSEGLPKSVEDFLAMLPTDEKARNEAIEKLITALNALSDEDDDFEKSLEDIGRPKSKDDDDYSAEFPGVEIDDDFRLGDLFRKLYYSDNPQMAIDLLFKQEQVVYGDTDEIWDDDEFAQIFKVFSEVAIEANGGIDTIAVNPTAERSVEQLEQEKDWLRNQIAKYEDPKFSGDDSPTSNDLIQIYKDRIALIDKAIREDPYHPGAYLAEGGAGAVENQRNLNDWNTAMGAMSSDALAKGQKIQADMDSAIDLYMTLHKNDTDISKAAFRAIS
jgi:hypothetical protein